MRTQPADRRCPAGGSAVDVESALCYVPCRLSPAGERMDHVPRSRRHGGRGPRLDVSSHGRRSQPTSAATRGRCAVGSRPRGCPFTGICITRGLGLRVSGRTDSCGSQVGAAPDAAGGRAGRARRWLLGSLRSRGLPGRAVRRETCCRQPVRPPSGFGARAPAQDTRSPARAGRSGRAGCIPVRRHHLIDEGQLQKPRLLEQVTTRAPGSRRTCPARRVVPPGGSL